MFRINSLAVPVAAAALLAASSAAAAPAEAFDARLRFGAVLAQDAVDPDYRARLRERFMFRDDPLPPDQPELDRLLRADEHEEMLALLRKGFASNAPLYLNWERRAVFEGGPLLTTILYAQDLWGLSEHAPEATGAQLKETALIMALYAYAQTEVEGERCADPKAGADRRRQLDELLAPIWAWGRQAPAALREQAKFMALTTEFITAPVRRNDVVLCQGAKKDEMTEITEGLAALGDKTPKLAKEQKGLGTTYVVPRPPAKFRPESEYRPRQELVRRQLADALDRQLPKG